MNDAKACQAVCDDLLTDQGIYVQAINYPTVERGEEKLRVTPSPHHTDEMIDDFINAVLTVWNKHSLPLKPEKERDPSQACHVFQFLETQADHPRLAELLPNYLQEPVAA